LDNPVEEKKKRTRRPKKKKNVIVESLATQLRASCTIENSVTKTTTVQVETLSVVLQSKSHILKAGTIEEKSQQNPNIDNIPRKIAKVILAFSLSVFSLNVFSYSF
jgi:dipeptide/tripeptide permease